MLNDAKIAAVLKIYDERMARDSEEMRTTLREEISEKRNNWLLPVGPDAGMLLNILARSNKAKTIVELGTSYGYSTVFLADAARETGGKIITFESADYKADYARDMLTKAGLEAYVDFRVGDALETLPKISEPIDFALIDLWKDLYLPCFEIMLPKLAPGAILVADNMISPADAKEEVARYKDRLRATGKFESMLLPVGSGLEVSRFIG